MPNFPRIVMVCTPLRLSFVGGGTDLPDFYRREGGSVFSTAIDKFVYVTVKRHGKLFDENYRLNYFNSEHAQSLSEIQNDIVRECLRFVPVDPPLYISTVADIPSSSGLGSSSAFAVGLLHALHVMRRDRISSAQLAEEACHIEIDVLGHPIGKQDQYAAALGGLNHINFNADGRVTVEPQRLSAEKVGRLFDHIMLFWTRMPRSANTILAEQRLAMPAKLENLRAMKDHCEQLREHLNRDGDVDAAKVGRILDATWNLKRDITGAISNHSIDGWYRKALDAGACGGKIVGAGGGGFLMLIVPPERQKRVAEALSELVQIDVDYEATGTRILIPLGH